MRASSRRLATALAERLGEVVPAPLTLRAEGDCISVYADGELLGGSASVSIVEDEDGRTVSERVAAVVLVVLGEIQDCVMEYLREEWPTDRGGKSALPDVRTEAGRINLWYGASEDEPVIRLRPIGFDDIQL